MRRPKKTVTINLSDYLSAGTYNVKVKSKGTDIRDSEDSNSVECVVAEAGYTVNVVFSNNYGESRWISTEIYDGYSSIGSGYYSATGNKIGEITSANGSTSVITTTGKICVSVTCSYLSPGTVTVTGGVTRVISSFDGSGTKGIPFDVSADGTITVDGCDYDG